MSSGYTCPLPPAVTLAMISGSSRSALIAYCESKPGPGPIREIVRGLPPGTPRILPG
jgi:hypothetical protein